MTDGYGTGSCFAELGSGAPLKHVQNRAASLQSWFRRTSTWGFFQADNAMKRTLFFKNRARVRGGLGKHTSTKFEKAFGSVIPSSIPESTAWSYSSHYAAADGTHCSAHYTCFRWRRQSKELAAITDDVESGLMNLMVAHLITMRVASSQLLR